jgi:hypothetical protein
MAMDDIVTVWFYVNPQDDSIEGLFAFFPMGMFIRTGGTWDLVTREESRIDTDLAQDDIYQLDWSSDEDNGVVDDSLLSEDFDGDHVAVKMYDNGELDVSELEKYAVKIIDHKDIISVPTQE